MGGVISVISWIRGGDRSRFDPGHLQKELDKLNVEIEELEVHDQGLVQTYRWLLKRAIGLAVLIELLVCVYWYFLAAPVMPGSPFVARFWPPLVLVANPIATWVLTRLTSLVYNRRISRTRGRIQELKEAGAQFIDDHLKAIDFQRTAAVLNKYAQRFGEEEPAVPAKYSGGKKKKPPAPQQQRQQKSSRTATPNPTAGKNKPTGLTTSQRPTPTQPQSEPAPTVVDAQTPQLTPVESAATLRRRPNATTSSLASVASNPSADGQGVSTSGGTGAVGPHSPLAQANPFGSSVPRMPVPTAPRRQVYRPPQARPTAWWDKAIDWLIGDGPQYGIAMLCAQCGEHNGLSPPEEPIDFRCRRCHQHNYRPSVISPRSSTTASPAPPSTDDSTPPASQEGKKSAAKSSVKKSKTK